MTGDIPKTPTNILDAAAIVLAQNPGAPISTIAKQAGIGRATLHRYYPKREDLLRALALNAIAQSDDVVLPLYREDKPKLEILKNIIRAMVPLGAYWHFLSLEYSVMADATVKKNYETQLERLSTLVNDVKTEQGLALDIPTAWITAVIDSLIYTAWISVEAGSVARNEAANLVIRTLFDGLSSLDTQS